MGAPQLIEATTAHLDVVAGWPDSAEACDLWAGGPVSFPIQRDLLEAQIAFEEADSVVLMAGGEVLAFGQILVRPLGRAHLSRLIVNPNRRGEGLGRALVSRMLERARERGFSSSTLNVHPGNTPAVSLYRSLGFEDAERPSGDFRPARESNFMSRAL